MCPNTQFIRLPQTQTVHCLGINSTIRRFLVQLYISTICCVCTTRRFLKATTNKVSGCPLLLLHYAQQLSCMNKGMAKCDQCTHSRTQPRRQTDGSAAHCLKWNKLDTACSHWWKPDKADINTESQSGEAGKHGGRENGCGAAGLVHTQGACVELDNLRWPVGYANKNLKLSKRDVIQIPSNA